MKHNNSLYNTLLTLSRNIYFYDKLKLPDNFETRIYLMLTFFSLFMIISKKKGIKFSQKDYDYFFHNLENNLREMGFGDVSVNKKMKEFNKILYDILLKIEGDNKNPDMFEINSKLVLKYFPKLKNQKSEEFHAFESYFLNFYNFCFELSLKNMIRESINFKG
tara:strand:- start:191 stop:679 length:489 start_codon:yes stop_codon:yes gene_type:complete